MKKFLGSAAFLSLFGLYSLYHYPDALGAVNATNGSASNTTVTTNSTGSLASAQASPPPAAVVAADDTRANANNESSAPKSALYKDGTYTGSSVYAYYGNVQVQATIAGGKITDVQFIQYPNDRRESLQISRQAMPYLTQEAIQAQSANVSGVSGASDTSAGFSESLAAALAQARS